MKQPFIMMAQCCGLKTQSSNCQTLNLNTHHYMYKLCKFTFIGFSFLLLLGLNIKLLVSQNLKKLMYALISLVPIRFNMALVILTSTSYGSSPPLCLCKLELECIYCLTQQSGGYIYIYIYNIYYIDNNYMFWHFSLAIFRLINEKLSKQLYSTCVYCIQWGGKR